MAALPTIAEFADGVRAGDRAMLARAITLVESAKGEHAAAAQELVQQLLPAAGKAHRIGITGVPGVGKSTAIDRLGANLLAAGHRVAVLAVDPSSTRSGGSILGDKTRMARLGKTREAMVLVEAAGFDVVIVETVGVGQSEAAVAGMVDFFLVLLIAGAGDELQGIKRGIIEIADMIAITKADGDNLARAMKALATFQAALAILRPGSADWVPPIMTISAHANRGLDELWAKIVEHRDRMTATGAFAAKRRAQAAAWMHDLLQEQLLAALYRDAALGRRIGELEEEVAAGKRTPALAVAELLAMLGLVRQGLGSAP